MFGEDLIVSMFLIFTGASILATLALYTRQAMIVAYILLGMIIGPNALALIGDANLIDNISHIGIIFLLFLLGLNLQPQSLLKTLERTAFITIFSSSLFAVIGFGVALVFGFDTFEAIIVGACMMFSSTIIGLKLLPTTILHHQHMGRIVISILLMQDLIAIALLMLFDVSATSNEYYYVILKLVIELPGLIGIAFLLERYVLSKLIEKFDTIKEYIFLLSIGWCLGITECAQILGLSHEIGAFIAGISIARETIALYISENLKPLRDFFLVLFFFALGAKFEFTVLSSVLIPAIILVLVMMVLKPKVFKILLANIKDPDFLKSDSQNTFAKEIGFRLGQLSEFSLLLVFAASTSFELSSKVTSLVLTATIISFIVSSYYIIMKFPTPLAVDDNLRRD